MLDKGGELGAKVRKPLLAVKGLVEPEEGEYRVGLKLGQPFIGGRELSRAPMQFIGVESFGAGKRPRCLARRMGAIPRGIAGAAQISHHHACVRELPVQLGLEVRKVLHPMSKAISDEHDALARGRFAGMNAGCSAQGDDQCQSHRQRLSYAFKPHSFPFVPVVLRAFVCGEFAAPRSGSGQWRETVPNESVAKPPCTSLSSME